MSGYDDVLDVLDGGDAALHGPRAVAVLESVGDSVLNEDVRSVTDLATKRGLSLAQARKQLADITEDIATYLTAAKHQFYLNIIPTHLAVLDDPKATKKSKNRAENQLMKLFSDKKNGLNINIDNRSITGYDDLMRKLAK